VAQRTCTECGKEITGRKRLYCSEKCGKHAPSRKRRYKRLEALAFDCAWCGERRIPGVDTHTHARKFCDSTCKRKWHTQTPWRGPCCRVVKTEPRRWIEGRCPECGDRFVRSSNRTQAVGYCSRKCQGKVKRRRYRAHKKGAGYKTLTYWSIAERDGWLCQLCGTEIDKTALVPEPLAATLDHIVPLSCGGEHSEANVQLAHFLCNSTKSDGQAVAIGAQTTLV